VSDDTTSLVRRLEHGRIQHMEHIEHTAKSAGAALIVVSAWMVARATIPWMLNYDDMTGLTANILGSCFTGIFTLKTVIGGLKWYETRTALTAQRRELLTHVDEESIHGILASRHDARLEAHAEHLAAERRRRILMLEMFASGLAVVLVSALAMQIEGLRELVVSTLGAQTVRGLTGLIELAVSILSMGTAVTILLALPTVVTRPVMRRIERQDVLREERLLTSEASVRGALTDATDLDETARGALSVPMDTGALTLSNTE